MSAMNLCEHWVHVLCPLVIFHSHKERIRNIHFCFWTNHSFWLLVLVLAFKALNGLGQGYLKDHFHPYEPHQMLSSTSEVLLSGQSINQIFICLYSYICSLRSFHYVIQDSIHVLPKDSLSSIHWPEPELLSFSNVVASWFFRSDLGQAPYTGHSQWCPHTLEPSPHFCFL